MKISADTFQSMKTETLKLMVEELGLNASQAVDLVQGAESNAYLCISEQEDGEGLEMPWVSGDYTDLANKFVDSIYGGVEYHFGDLQDWRELYARIEGCAVAVLRTVNAETITADKAILEMIRRNMKTAEIAEDYRDHILIEQYEYAIHELAIAYSISESENSDYPLTIAQVCDRAMQRQDLFPL